MLPGVGWAACLVAYITAFYYNVILGWSIYYLFASFTFDLPWTTCTNDWNTPRCREANWLKENGSDFLLRDSLLKLNTGKNNSGIGSSFECTPEIMDAFKSKSLNFSRPASPSEEYFE